LAIVGFALSLDAIRQPETTTEGRLTAHGSNPISLARIGSLTLAFAWIRFQLAQKPHDKLLYIGVLAVSCICVLGAGSRGPVLSIVLATAAISFHTRRYHGRSPISVGAMLLIIAIATIVISFAAIPSLPLYRFQLLFSEDKGTSVLLRGMLMTTAFKLMLANPFGLGVGGFARHAVLDLRYPHNLFLEVGSELGWIPLIGLMLLMAWSIRVLFQILAREYSWSALFLAVVVLASSMNSMVTGDLNDNRALFAVLLLPFAYRQSAAIAPVARAAVRYAGHVSDRTQA